MIDNLTNKRKALLDKQINKLQDIAQNQYSKWDEMLTANLTEKAREVRLLLEGTWAEIARLEKLKED